MVDTQPPVRSSRQLGRLCLRLWENLHFQQSALHPMHLIQVEHLDEFVGRNPDLYGSPGFELRCPRSEFWRLYRRRFAIDHWYRFAKIAYTGLYPN